MKAMINCKHCDKRITKYKEYKDGHRKRIYCDDKCRRAYVSAHTIYSGFVTVECATCGKKITVAKYSSRWKNRYKNFYCDYACMNLSKEHNRLNFLRLMGEDIEDTLFYQYMNK